MLTNLCLMKRIIAQKQSAFHRQAQVSQLIKTLKQKQGENHGKR